MFDEWMKELVAVILAVLVCGLILIGYAEGRNSVHPKSETTTTTVPAGRICITIAGSQLPPGVYCRTP